jgi:3-dehydroquinate synthetase
VGHALEAASGFRLPHGEAVAWGLLAILEASLAHGLSREEADRLERRVVTLVAPRPLARATREAWQARLGADKKADASGLKAIFLPAPGKPVILPVEPGELASGLHAATSKLEPVLALQ